MNGLDPLISIKYMVSLVLRWRNLKQNLDILKKMKGKQ
jgi:hypothetical protein